MIEHLAAKRWATEKYDRTKAELGIHGISQLETLARRAKVEVAPTDPTERRIKEAEHQAIYDALEERKASYGL